MLRMIATPMKILRFLGKSMSDQWHGIVSRNSYVSKLKTWMPEHSKNKQINKINAQASGFSQGSFVETNGQEQPSKE